MAFDSSVKTAFDSSVKTAFELVVLFKMALNASQVPLE